MRARRIYSDPQEQKQHIENFNALSRLVFLPEGRSIIEKELGNHPGRTIAISILDINSKIELLDDDFKEFELKVKQFWTRAFQPKTSHMVYCRLQRDVWRSAFHVAISAQSLSETIISTMQKFSTRKKIKGKKIYDYWIHGFKEKWNVFISSPIYKFNYCLRGALYHVRLLNPDWVSFKDFVTGEQEDRFIIDRDILNSLAARQPEALQYVQSHSTNVRGSRKKKDDEPYGVDLVSHFHRYRVKLRKLGLWLISQLKDPYFGNTRGLDPHCLEEYLDWERACKGVSKKWKRCKHCGHWL